jgi:hypothetical protein
MSMRDQLCFGYLSISVQGDVGAVTLDPDFSGSEEDRHDWNDLMEWCWARGLRLASEDPALVAGDGTQIYLLRRQEPDPWRQGGSGQWSAGFPVPAARAGRVPAPPTRPARR